MNKFNVIVIALFAASLIQAAPTKPDEHEDPKEEMQNKMKIAKMIAKDYDKLYSPGNTTLKVRLSFMCAQYDMQDKHLHTTVFERYSWKDWRLQWDPSQFGDVKVLKVPAELVWKPDDIRLHNAVVELEERGDVRLEIFSDGTVYWVTPTTYTTVCGPGEKMHDRKGHCHLSLGTWTYDAEDIHMELMDEGVDTKHYLHDCPHVMKDIKARIKTSKYDCCENTFDSLEVDFDLEERKKFKSHESHSESSSEEDKRKHHPKVPCQWPHCTKSSHDD